MEPVALPELVPSSMPAALPPPEPRRKIPIWKAIPLHWILPRRVGPHLSCGSWRRAWAVHVLCVLFAYAAFNFGLLLGAYPGFYGLVSFRLVLAEFVISAAMGDPWDLAFTLGLLLGWPILEIGLLLAATLTAPWAAAGDRFRDAWKRQYKNVLWCSTWLIPASIWAGVLMSLAFPYDWGNLARVALSFCAVAMYSVVLGASRIVGEGKGPGFEPHEPKCEDCGYPIRELRVTSNCPECGLAVRDSMPGGRRRPSEWQCRHGLRRVIALFALNLRIVLGRFSFKTLAVQGDLAAARSFWSMTWLTSTLVTAVLAYPVCMAALGMLPDGAPVLTEWWPIVLDAMWLAVFVVTISLPAFTFAMVFVGTLLWRTRFGPGDIRAPVAALLHCSLLGWPLILAAWVFGLLQIWAVQYGLTLRKLPWPFKHWSLADGLALALLVFFISALMVIAFGIARVLRAVRYANS